MLYIWYLDYAKAFDNVSHQLLLKKLRRYRFNERLISWIESFLAERYQQVVINGESSYSAQVRAVVYLRVPFWALFYSSFL